MRVQSPAFLTHHPRYKLESVQNLSASVDHNFFLIEYLGEYFINNQYWSSSKSDKEIRLPLSLKNLAPGPVPTTAIKLHLCNIRVWDSWNGSFKSANYIYYLIVICNSQAFLLHSQTFPIK